MDIVSRGLQAAVPVPGVVQVQARCRMRWVFAILLVSSAALAGEATVSDEFTIDAPFDRVSEWVDASAAKIRESCNVQLVEQAGNELTLRRENNRGRWVWKQRETVTRAKGSYRYVTALSESVEGGISRLDAVVIIEESGGRTKVSASTTAAVDGLRDKEVRFDLLARARRVKKVMKESLE